MAFVTNAVVAIAVVLFPANCVVAIVPVGNVGVPVNVGEALITKVVPVPVCKATEVVFPELVIGPVKLAFVALAFVTNAVVANCKLLDPAVAVGAKGMASNVLTPGIVCAVADIIPPFVMSAGVNCKTPEVRVAPLLFEEVLMLPMEREASVFRRFQELAVASK